MDALMVLRTFAAITTVIAAALVAANLNARLMALGFAVFVVASLAWIVDGYIEAKTSLIVQNVALLLINIFGLWRWLPRAAAGASRGVTSDLCDSVRTIPARVTKPTK